jgi:SpoVK/Ycf46/Vps4 family AAA+-type ATPase
MLPPLVGRVKVQSRFRFEAAERASAVLLFDEADSLFGKRTEIRDAHDRYANLEVAYLLQRMEAYRGLAVLTTNFKQNLDAAFLRRLRFMIELPAPDARSREAIWERAFPENAPRAKDLNLTFLAHKLALTGGHIQQIAIRAAFLAAAESAEIGICHVIRATRYELVKLGMLNAEKNLADLAA